MSRDYNAVGRYIGRFEIEFNGFARLQRIEFDAIAQSVVGSFGFFSS